MFHHFRRADAIHILDKPTDFLARPGNYVPYRTRLFLLGSFRAIIGAQPRASICGTLTGCGKCEFTLTVRNCLLMLDR